MQLTARRPARRLALGAWPAAKYLDTRPVPAGSHTPGDLLVYLPDYKVLIGGDVLVNRLVPTMMDGNVRNWIGTLVSSQNSTNYDLDS